MSSQSAPAPSRSFAALRHAGYRTYFITSALAMMADSIEHVISYWIVFEKFHSPALGGVAILTHWLTSTPSFSAVTMAECLAMTTATTIRIDTTWAASLPIPLRAMKICTKNSSVSGNPSPSNL